MNNNANDISFIDFLLVIKYKIWRRSLRLNGIKVEQIFRINKRSLV